MWLDSTRSKIIYEETDLWLTMRLTVIASLYLLKTLDPLVILSSKEQQEKLAIMNVQVRNYVFRFRRQSLRRVLILIIWNNRRPN